MLISLYFVWCKTCSIYICVICSFCILYVKWLWNEKKTKVIIHIVGIISQHLATTNTTWYKVQTLCIKYVVGCPVQYVYKKYSRVWDTFNSLALGGCNLELAILKIISRIDSLSLCPVVNGTIPHRWLISIGSGNGLVPSGNKSLPESMLTQTSLLDMYVAIWCHQATMSWRLKLLCNINRTPTDDIDPHSVCCYKNSCSTSWYKSWWMFQSTGGNN